MKQTASVDRPGQFFDELVNRGTNRKSSLLDYVTREQHGARRTLSEEDSEGEDDLGAPSPRI